MVPDQSALLYAWLLLNTSFLAGMERSFRFSTGGLAMPIRHSQFHCPTCRRATMHVRNDSQVNHVLHLLASVFLCGLWLPVWFYLALTRALAGGEPWRCQTCGTAAGSLA